MKYDSDTIAHSPRRFFVAYAVIEEKATGKVHVVQHGGIEPRTKEEIEADLMETINRHASPQSEFRVLSYTEVKLDPEQEDFDEDEEEEEYEDTGERWTTIHFGKFEIPFPLIQNIPEMSC